MRKATQRYQYPVRGFLKVIKELDGSHRSKIKWLILLQGKIDDI